MHDLPPQGLIDNVFPPRLVAGLHIQEFEGMLRLTLPDAIKVLYFKKGEVASAASNAEPDRLANILMHEGRLTAEQLDMARARLQAGASLGRVLIEMGFLTPSELLQGARQQVRIIIASCFAATSGSYEMVPGPLPAEVTSLGLNTRRLLFDCLVEAGDRAAIVREVGSMEAVYRPTDQLNFILTSLKLDSETDRIGRLLNGSTSLRDISGRTSLDDFTVSKVVLALDLLGAAERVPPEEEVEAPATRRGRTIPIVTEAQDGRAEPAAAEIFVDSEEAGIAGESVPVQAPAAIAAAVEEAIPGAGPSAALAVTEAIESTPDPVAPYEPAADEPPPIPQDELPAFAQTPGEPLGGPENAPGPGDGPQWQIDPETGERVHVGPIELTFDGRIAPGSGESRNFIWILLAAGAVTLVVAGALGYVILRRGAGAPAAARLTVAPTPATIEPIPRTVTEAPSGSAAAAAPLGVAPVGAAPVGAAPGNAAPAPGTPSSTPAPREEAQAGRPAPRAASSETPAVVRATPPSPAPARAPETSPPGDATGPGADPRFGAALQRFDQGDAAGAARLFEQWIVSGSPRRFSLQLMIACQEETVKAARSRAGAESSLFILPYDLKGRPCYRVCWGVYDDSASARDAVRAVPPALTGETVPLVVPLSRLRTSG